MDCFHPNAFDTDCLSEPAKRILRTLILLGLQRGTGGILTVSIETLSAATGLDQLEGSVPSIKALLVECAKALALLKPDDESGEDVPEASCPVFLAIRLIDDQVFFELDLPVYSLSMHELDDLLPMRPLN
ncbi:hypothetical protein [Kerstersia gyiorum]|uniref:hypothetical protein n=1 Tax=Kerstersia gyiorum TaxID=206506 RepID=UPI0020A125E5|nr:hypothetical protein [Kerstersia gyiorum]MCP1634813.1 hypothetical protein [Kerstersia gyiorum]MCP1638137.1 hypothetical protein [Kerstersia gyiorum]MCP1672727.1 hypothetical protein [Kerstersia gyiorum]MCP1680641.1 hypothetical protein [Kerstersia gyiorum]MCP1683922.1 hypothetical protein [Kerstersia gyiorum]